MRKIGPSSTTWASFDDNALEALTAAARRTSIIIAFPIFGEHASNRKMMRLPSPPSTRPSVPAYGYCKGRHYCDTFCFFFGRSGTASALSLSASSISASVSEPLL